MGAKMKPVYMINGFLESGKTEFISFTLAQNYFQIKGKTLLILCEEGENEYDRRERRPRNLHLALSRHPGARHLDRERARRADAAHAP